MSQPQPTRLDRLLLRNFRCFSEVDLRLDSRLTVLVAPNGGGKTALLDGIAIGWRRFVDVLQTRQSSVGFLPTDVRRVLGASWNMEPQLPTLLEAEGESGGQRVKWTLKRDSVAAASKTRFGGASRLVDAAVGLAAGILSQELDAGAEPAVLPFVGYYGTARLFSGHRLSRQRKSHGLNPTSRLNGYSDCLSGASTYRFFTDWFERYSREAQKENGSAGPSPHQPKLKLQAVTEAVDSLLRISGWHALEWDFAEDVIVARHEQHGRLAVDALSDGIRNMIGLAGDIAHRCVRLNPQFGAAAARQTPGMVLIDEVDLHLHPEWQQTVVPSLLEAFPSMQFVVTTHSPQVLTTVRKENIRMLLRDDTGAWEAKQPAQSPLARESGDALAFIMATHPRPQVGLLDDVHAYEQLARTGQSTTPEAMAIKARLDQGGFEFSDADRALFALLAARKQPGNGGRHG